MVCNDCHQAQGLDQVTRSDFGDQELVKYNMIHHHIFLSGRYSDAACNVLQEKFGIIGLTLYGVSAV